MSFTGQVMCGRCFAVLRQGNGHVYYGYYSTYYAPLPVGAYIATKDGQSMIGTGRVDVYVVCCLLTW